MTSRAFDPRHLPVEAFAKEGGMLEGEWPLASMQRLAEAAHADARPGEHDQVTWRAEGESRPVRGGAPQVWLHLRANARLSLVCQRCLGPIEEAIVADRHFMFVAGEDTAAELDADSEDDVLALTRSLDLRDLVEDELLLALPLVPRHDVCPEPLPMTHGEVGEEELPNPFAALAALKRGGAPN